MSHDESKSSVCVATSAIARLKGLLGTQSFDGQMLLAPCRDVHTVGMRYPIDVAFVDGKGMVVKVVRGVEPGRRIRCREACMVLERQSNADGAWYGEGERIAVSSAW